MRRTAPVEPGPAPTEEADYEEVPDVEAESADDASLPEAEMVESPGRPPKSGKAKRPKKRMKKAAKQKKAQGPNQLLLVFGGLGAVILVLGFVVGGIVLSRGSRDPGAEGRQPATAEEARQSGFQVFDQPLPDVPVAVKDTTPPLFVEAPPFDPEKALRRKRTARGTPPGGAADQKPAEEKPRWSVPTDPAPAREPIRYAADLRIPLEKCAVTGFARPYAPVLADLDGPFAAFVPAWKGPVFENVDLTRDKTGAKPEPDRHPGTAPGTKTYVSLVAKPSAPVPVIDLRTGKTVGEFNYRVPIWRNPVLSPDATYLVGPDAVPDDIAQVHWAEVFTLFVWKQREEKPCAKLKVPGWVTWFGFISRDQLAVLTFDGKPLVQVWDVAKGEVLRSIYLTAEQLVPAVVAKELKGHERRVSAFCQIWPTLAGVSPGGRYLAVGGKSTVTLVGLAEGREIGALPVNLSNSHFSNFKGISFSPDGKELTAWTVARFPHYEGGLATTWSVITGQKLRELKSPTSSPGPVIPGPDPEILLATGRLSSELNSFATAIELPTGRAFHSLPTILRWSPTGPIVVLGPLTKPGEPAPQGPAAGLGGGDIGVYAMDDAQSRLRTALGLTEHGLPKRPKVTVTDRSQVQARTPQAPASWSPMPPAKAIAPPEESNLLGPTEWPDALGDHQAATLRLTNREKPLRFQPIRYLETTWERFDLSSGKSLGEPILVAPWAVAPGAHPQRKYLAALSSDGEKLAMDDLANPGRIDVWSAAGKHVVAFLPCGVPPEGADARGTKAVIEWLGWGPDGKLLTMSDGVLTAWDTPAAKAVWEIDGGYSLPLEFAPGRTWLAASTVSGIDLINPSTGKLLNRCAVGAPGKITDIAVSPDCTQMAALYVKQESLANSFIEKRRIREHADAVVALWDLNTGKARASQLLRTEQFGLLCWGSPEHLAVCGRATQVMDLRLGITPLSYRHNSTWPDQGFPLNRTPDGRLWAAVFMASPDPYRKIFTWRPQRLPNPQGEKDGPFASPEREFFAASRSPIRFECSVGDEALGERCGKAVLENLQKAGFQIGPDGWVLRVTHQVTDSGGSFMNGIAVPKIDYEWQLIDDTGKVTWKGTSEGAFAGRSSKYYRRPRLGDPQVPVGPNQWVDHFEFGLRDPKEAIIEEIRERNTGLMGLHTTFPKTFFKVGDAYLKQPETVDFNVSK